MSMPTQLAVAAMISLALGACSDPTPVTGKTQSLPMLAKPERTDMTPSVVPSAEQALGSEPVPAAKAPVIGAEKYKTLSKADESNRMPLPGQANDHSVPEAAPAAKK
jgi:hypothetical protein